MKKFILFSFIFVLGAAGYVFYLYNKPHQSIRKQAADFTISAEKLFNEFDSNEEAANKTYLGKILAVHGQISSVVKEGPGMNNVLLATGGLNSVCCQMEEKAGKEIDSLIPGDSITLKGVCTGMLMDVVLVDCVVERD